MMNDHLAATLSNILTQEKLGRKQCHVHPSSTFIRNVLSILNKEGYVGNYDLATDQKGGVLCLHLLGSINKCGAIKPRFPVTLSEYEKFEKRFLPAKDMGVLIVSTPTGLMTHLEAKKKHTGGRLIAFCY